MSANACPTGRGRRALLLGLRAGPPAEEGPVAVISGSCFALRGVACISRSDACPTSAVRLELSFGGARPRVESAACTGCGECAPACPAEAIAVVAPMEAARA